jgi:predicted nuclease of predicted toxin-antitoxin system
MQFLCDVHISFKLVNTITNLGFECIHINTILDKWFTKDAVIALFADENYYVLITKDADFRNSFLLKNSPKKLIKINLGNISNTELISIFEKNLYKMAKLADVNERFMFEIDNDSISFLSL